MRIPGHERCFVCGRDSELSLDFSPFDGGVEAEFVPSERFVGFEGVIHGGITATVLAEAMGTAAATVFKVFLGRRICVDYLRPVRPGRRYRVVAETVRVEGRSVLCRGRVYDERGEVCAEGEGLFVRVGEQGEV